MTQNGIDRRLNVNGFSIPTLDNLTFDHNEAIDENFTIELPNCTYRTPSALSEPLRDSISFLSFNIRSMYQNFDNFRSEIWDQMRSLDVVGMCETRLTEATANLYSLEGYNLYTTNVSSQKRGVC